MTTANDWEGWGVCQECGRRTGTVSITACPACGGAVVSQNSAISGEAVAQPPRGVTWRLPPLRYPNAYAWFVFVSSLDVMLTWMILHFGGQELNSLASRVIDRGDLPGLVLFKFCLVMFFVVLCEAVGRRQDNTGRWLSRFAVAITCVPVVISFVLLLGTR